MVDEQLPKKFSMENYLRWPDETLQRHNQSISEGFLISKGFGHRLHRSDKNGEASSIKEQLYEEKKICETEGKRREHKANTYGPSAVSMILTCSTCNRHFRATLGLVSHQRTI